MEILDLLKKDAEVWEKEGEICVGKKWKIDWDCWNGREILWFWHYFPRIIGTKTKISQSIIQNYNKNDEICFSSDAKLESINIITSWWWGGDRITVLLSDAVCQCEHSFLISFYMSKQQTKTNQHQHQLVYFKIIPQG